MVPHLFIGIYSYILNVYVLLVGLYVYKNVVNKYELVFRLVPAGKHKRLPLLSSS